MFDLCNVCVAIYLVRSLSASSLSFIPHVAFWYIMLLSTWSIDVHSNALWLHCHLPFVVTPSLSPLVCCVTLPQRTSSVCLPAACWLLRCAPQRGVGLRIHIVKQLNPRHASRGLFWGVVIDTSNGKNNRRKILPPRHSPWCVHWCLLMQSSVLCTFKNLYPAYHTQPPKDYPILILWAVEMIISLISSCTTTEKW